MESYFGMQTLRPTPLSRMSTSAHPPSHPMHTLKHQCAQGTRLHVANTNMW